MVGEERAERGERVGRGVVFGVQEAGQGVVAYEVDLEGVGGVEGRGGQEGGFGVEVGEGGDGDVDGDVFCFAGSLFCFLASLFCFSLLGFQVLE